MRQPRLKAPPGHPVGYHHVLSRVVNRDFVFGDCEREHFVRLMRQYESFCGVRVLTFCILSNHFHILLEVPARPATALSDPELLGRCAAIYSAHRVQEIRRELELRRDQPEQWAAYRERFLGRMWDVSHYLKSLKQRLILDGWITTKQVCTQLGISRTTLGKRRRKGLIKGRICTDLGEWLYWPPDRPPQDPDAPDPFNRQRVTSTAGDAL